MGVLLLFFTQFEVRRLVRHGDIRSIAFGACWSDTGQMLAIGMVDYLGCKEFVKRRPAKKSD